MFKKKKYEHSEWMKGFLWAEKKHPPGAAGEVFVEDCDGMESRNILYRNYSDERPWVVWEGSGVSVEFGQGVIDYLEHRKLLQ